MAPSHEEKTGIGGYSKRFFRETKKFIVHGLSSLSPAAKGNFSGYPEFIIRWLFPEILPFLLFPAKTVQLKNTIISDHLRRLFYFLGKKYRDEVLLLALPLSK